MSLVAFLACFSIAKKHYFRISEIVFLYGQRWIRTTEASCSRFTVCPLWPLGNLPRCDENIFYMYFRLTVKKYIISSNHTQDFFLLVLDFLVSIKICINNFSFWFSKTLLPLYFVICIFGHLYIYIVLLKFCIMYCPAHVQTFCIYLFYVEFLTMHIPLHISYFTYPIVKYFQNVRLGCWAKAVNNLCLVQDIRFS